jgi:hypothetical protein
MAARLSGGMLPEHIATGILALKWVIRELGTCNSPRLARQRFPSSSPPAAVPDFTPLRRWGERL